MNKQKCYAWLFALAAAVTTTACHDDIGYNSGSAVGKIAPHLELNTKVEGSKKAASRAEWNELTASDLALKITSNEGSYSGSWNSIDEFPTNNTFAVGSYLVEASYGSVEKEGFECPAYYGSQTITVREDEVSDVNITASLANTMVVIDYTDEFKNYMTDWSAEVHATGGEYQYYAKDETRPCYLRPGTVVVNVEVTKPNGNSAKLYAAEFDAVAAHLYNITIDINSENGGAGDVSLVVKYDDTLVQQDVVIDLSDDIISAPAPTISGDGVVSGQKFSYVEGTSLAAAPKLNIIARGSIAAVTLTTQSTDLISKGWPAEVNLANASASDLAALKNLGLNALGLWQNPDKMAVVDFTDVLPNTAGATFTVEVRDRYNKVSEAFSFEVEMEELQMEIVSAETFLFGSDEVTLNIKYNGNIENLKIFASTSFGTDKAATIKSAIDDDNDGIYAVTFDADSELEEIEVYAKSGDKQTDKMTIKRADAPVTVAYSEDNIWATKATVNGTIVNADQVSDVKLAYRKSGNTAWTTAETTVSGTALSADLAGLSANTTYELAALSNNKVVAAKTTFTTEAATQLPNSDFETAPSTSASGSNYTCYVYPDGWGTNNPMTTSQGVDVAYCRISGTIPTTDVHGGSQAVLIRTVGWGSGNTNSGSAGINSIKYIDAGLLHLGSDRSSRPSGYSDRTGTLTTNDLTTGLTFASRPSSMSLWYKYSEKKSDDHGVAEVYVYDANDNIIASGSADLTSASDYTQKTISLDYTSGAGKAAKIYVKFLSTYSESFLAKSNDYLSSGNRSWIGSNLYIDDITLNY